MRLRGLAVTLFVLAVPALATTLLSLDVAGLTKTSDLVVRGVVTKVQPRWTKDHARIITDIEIQVAETWKGVGAKTLVAMQPGGEVGDVGQRISGIAKFQVGEEVVVFLEARGDRFTVSGMEQGKYRVERTATSTVVRSQVSDAAYLDPNTRQPVERQAQVLTLEQLRAQVLAASGSSPDVTVPGTTRVGVP